MYILYKFNNYPKVNQFVGINPITQHQCTLYVPVYKKPQSKQSTFNDKSSKTNSTIQLKSASRNFKLIEGRKLKRNIVGVGCTVACLLPSISLPPSPTLSVSVSLSIPFSPQIKNTRQSQLWHTGTVQAQH